MGVLQVFESRLFMNIWIYKDKRSAKKKNHKNPTECYYSDKSNAEHWRDYGDVVTLVKCW